MEECIIEQKKCKHCSVSFEITDLDLEFYDKVSPVFLGKKYNFPTPTLCPDCRQQRRLSCRNERSLYTRTSDNDGTNIISIYSPNKDFKVFSHKHWWSDDWEPLDYWIDFDFNKSFFENFKELDLRVPKLATTIQNSENCEYTNDTWDSNNCYLSYRTHYSENISYSYRANKSSNCIDCYQVKESENLYECFQSNKCQNSKYLYKCNNSHTSYFLYNCEWSNNSFLSYNLVNASYNFLNKQYSKEEYTKKLNDILGDPIKFEEAKQHFFSLLKKDIIFRDLDNVNCDDCTWNELIDCHSCTNCFMMKGCEWSKHAWDNVNYKNSMDNYSGGGSEYSYETLATKNSFKNSFTHRVKESNNLMYCTFTFFSNNCFWCTAIRNKEFCIFNKQYTKAEYDVLVPKIIKHMEDNWEWGEFFPTSISQFGYNETVASEYFPLTKEDSVNLWFNWSNYEQPVAKAEKIIPAASLPNDIKEIPDDILNWAIKCEVTAKPFRIIPQELDFYRKNNLPIPRRHPDQRHLDRISLRNPRKLFDRTCTKCSKNIESTYSQERQENVFCTECYKKEIY